MTKSELIAAVKTSIESACSEDVPYFLAKNEGIELSDKHLEKETDDDVYASQVDYVDRTLFKRSAQLAAEHVVSVLADHGFLNVD